MATKPHNDPEYLRDLLRHWLLGSGIIAPEGETQEHDADALNDAALDTLRAMAPLYAECAEALVEMEAARQPLHHLNQED